MGPKKKKKKRRDTLLMTDDELEEQAEARKRAEQERLERERILKELEEELKRAKIEKKKQNAIDMKFEEFRNRIIKEHCDESRTFMKEQMDYLIEKRREKEWEMYVSCNHLPLADDPPALNTFLYTWSLIEDQLNMDNILPESEIILETVQAVEMYLYTPLDMKEKTVKNLREVKLNYYEQVLKNVNKVTFDAIMDVKKFHKHIKPGQMEIYKKSENLMLYMWGWSLEGRCEAQPKKRRPERKFPGMLVTLPGILETKRYHLRVFHTSYDPYSFQSPSYHPPQVDVFPDLYEETVNIRKMEIKALKARYMNSYDEDIMPWWFMMDKEVMEDKAKKELAKKPKPKKKKGHHKQEEVTVEVKPTNIDEPAIERRSRKSGKDKSLEDDDYEKRDIQQSISRVGHTDIVYSQSMCDLLEKRRYECTGPEYFSEVDPIEYLEQSSFSSLGSLKERYKELFKSEKHTTFKANLYTEDDRLSDGIILRDINDGLNRSGSSEEKLSLTNRRVFLDWKSMREISPDREAIRGELEDILFGDKEMVIENGEIKFVRRNPNLRSIKELMSEIRTRTSVFTVRERLEEVENVAEEVPNVVEEPNKITNVTEMKALEMEISNVLDAAWQDYMEEYVSKLEVRLEPGSINLREVEIIGGVFQFDFFEDEPQPYVNTEKFKTQLHYGEYELKLVPFDQIPKVRIDLAAEVDRQVNLAKKKKSVGRVSRFASASSIEAQPDEDSDSAILGDDDLVWIVLELPKRTIYHDTPVPVHWNAEKMYWTTDDVYDAKWNERTYKCSFKLGKSGPFAITVYSFANLPYINFCMKPSSNWSKNPEIELEITTRNFPILFKIKEDTITIDKLDDYRADYVSHIINVPFKFEDLVVAMRSCGINLFPDWDSFLYINISLKKLRTLEEHMYYCMGCSAPAFEYASSVHNAVTRDDRIYVQLRERVDKTAPPPKYETILVNPFKVSFVNAERLGMPAEESEDGFGYTPDLKYLTQMMASKKALRRMKRASKRTIGTLIRFLTATKILTYG